MTGKLVGKSVTIKVAVSLCLCTEEYKNAPAPISFNQSDLLTSPSLLVGGLSLHLVNHAAASV